MSFARGETVQHHAFIPGTEDDGYGESDSRFADPVPWGGVAFAPGTSSEPLAGGSTRISTPATLYDPQGRHVDPRDEFTVRGVRYFVVGDASGEWVNPWTGWHAGTAISLKVVTGG